MISTTWLYNILVFLETHIEKITTDITYLDYGPKKLYLSSIMDLFNGEILSYTVNDKQNSACILDTLNQLKNLPENFILHSVQGSVYTSSAYYEATKILSEVCPKKGHPLIMLQ